MNLKDNLKKLTERRTGTYAAVKYDQSTLKILTEWMKIWNIPDFLVEEKLHTTVLYSRAPLHPEDYKNLDAQQLKALGWKFAPKALDRFSSSSDKNSPKNVLVLKLEAPELVTFHQSLIQAGATHDFPTYEPHITLSYEVPDSFDISKLVLPPVYFIPVKLYFEPLDLNWESK